jgi:hypothetical protein
MRDYISRVLLFYTIASLIVPAFALLFYVIFWILNILDPNASYITFLQDYFYSGELLPGMQAWRVHIVLFGFIAGLSLPIWGNNNYNDYDEN